MSASSNIPDGLFGTTENTPDPDRELADKMVRDFLGTKMDNRKRPSPKTIGNAAWGKLLSEVKRMFDSGQWGAATPRHFVALYEMLHSRVYGVDPSELGPSQRLFATGMALRMLDGQFDGNVVAMVEYMRWAWVREEGRESWRKSNNIDGGRIGWRLMFNGTILTDYRRANVRKVAR